jgi:hypothetical protein
MRTLLLVFCALLIVCASMDAKKKVKIPASQRSAEAKQHQAMVKQYAKSHKAPKHHQKVN